MMATFGILKTLDDFEDLNFVVKLPLVFRL